MTRTTDYYLDDIRRFLSEWDVARLEKLGATVTRFAVTATEEQLGKWYKPELRAQLARAGVLTVSGGAPDWVPADAKIYIDLIAPGRAWTEDDGEVDIDTLLGTDANTEGWWGTTGYNAASLTADGYTQPPTLAAIGGLRTKLIDSATGRVQWKQTELTGGADGLSIAVMSANGDDAVELDLHASLHASSGGGPLSTTTSDIRNQAVGAINVVAFTLTNDRIDIAANGSAAVAGSILSDDRPAGNPLVAAIFDGQLKNALQSITIYDALPSTAGLSALSDTVVTNTAPTSLRAISWRATAYSTSTGDHAITLSLALLANVGSDNLPLLMLDPAGEQVNDFEIIDPQGNPVGTVSLVSASDPIIQMWSSSGDADIGSVASSDCYVTIVGSPPDIPAGAYTFTLRAADPGGLYVEQEFTITVTA